MRILHFVFATAFLVMAGLQFNDPDPLYWVLAYGGAALVALAKGIGRYSEFWTAVMIGAVIAGLLVALPSVLELLRYGKIAEIYGPMMASKPYVESSREFGGLLIVLAVLLSYVRRR